MEPEGLASRSQCPLQRARPSSPRPPSYWLKTHFNIILQPVPRSSRWSLSLSFPHQNPACTTPLSHVSHSPPISFFLIYPNIWWEASGVVGWGTASHDEWFRVRFLVGSLDLENFPSVLFLPSAFSSPLNRKWVTRYFLGDKERPVRGANNSADLVVPNVKVRTEAQNSTPLYKSSRLVTGNLYI